MYDKTTYLLTEDFPVGTKFNYLNLSEAEIGEGGYVIQTKRGTLAGEECYRIFTTLQNWLDTLPKLDGEYKINIEIPTQSPIKKIVPPTFPIYMETLSSPYDIVKAINEKNGAEFTYKRSPSLSMIHAKAKAARLELESKESWQLLKISNPMAWQKEYSKLTRAVVSAYINVQNSLNPTVMPYQVHNPRYPRVFVKMETAMYPIYHISDGSEYIYVDGRVGKTFSSVGLVEYPEFWISWEGKLIRQRVHFFIPHNFDTGRTPFTQEALKLLYVETPNEEGCLSNSKQVLNIKTKMYLQPWHVF
jgi:hypothetical protein